MNAKTSQSYSEDASRNVKTGTGTRIAALEAQLRHLTLPTQRGYRRKIEKHLDILRHAEPLTKADWAILEALKFPSQRIYGRWDKLTKPWLYAAADRWDSKKADRSRWFVTGPVDRRAYIKGPFDHRQVERIAASGMLIAVCSDEDGPMAYELANGVIGIDA